MPPKKIMKKKFNKRKFTRKSNMPRQMNNRAPKYLYKRFSNGAVINGSDITPNVFTSFAYTLADVASFSEFTALYDQYRIHGVELTFKINVDPSAQSAVQATYPVLWYVNDYDDDAVVTLQQLQQYSSCKRIVLRPNAFKRIYIRPAVSSLIYQSAVSSGFTPKWKVWLDAANAIVPHYGLKAIAQGLQLRYSLEVTAKYYLEFRTPR